MNDNVTEIGAARRDEEIDGPAAQPAEGGANFEFVLVIGKRVGGQYELLDPEDTESVIVQRQATPVDVYDAVTLSQRALERTRIAAEVGASLAMQVALAWQQQEASEILGKIGGGSQVPDLSKLRAR